MTAHDTTRFPIKVCPAPPDGKRYPIVVLLHGNFGLDPRYAGPILDFAEQLAKSGYVTAVPRYYPDNQPHFDDNDPDSHVATITSAIDEVGSRADADPDRLGLVGYSLGGGVAMSYICGNLPDRVKVFVDYFGFLPAGVRTNAKFPPTAIFHNRLDGVVPFAMSLELLRRLDPRVEVRVAGYVEDGATPGNHMLDLHGQAYLDSGEAAEQWIKRHLPPAGS